jgi:hypothetical protein
MSSLVTNGWKGKAWLHSRHGLSIAELRTSWRANLARVDGWIGLAASLTFAVGHVVFEAELLSALVCILRHGTDVPELLRLVSLLDGLRLKLDHSAALGSGRVPQLWMRLLRLLLRLLLQGT